jgi:hypothetical protein
MMLPTPRREVIFKEMAEGGVLFHTVDEVYYGLNGVGCQVWKLLPPVSDSFDGLCEEIQRQHPAVPLDTIRADVQELFDDLIEFGLLSPGEAGSERVAAPLSSS